MDCVGPLEVPGGRRLGDAVTVGQSGRAGLRVTLAEDGGTFEVRGPHLTGLRGDEPMTLELEQAPGDPACERS